MTDHVYITSHRRYCLLKRQWAAANHLIALAATWAAKQEAEPGSDLPSDFPFRGRLADAFYTKTEDLDGADVAELSDLGCFTVAEANQILQAFQQIG